MDVGGVVETRDAAGAGGGARSGAWGGTAGGKTWRGAKGMGGAEVMLTVEYQKEQEGAAGAVEVKWKKKQQVEQDVTLGEEQRDTQ